MSDRYGTRTITQSLGPDMFILPAEPLSIIEMAGWRFVDVKFYSCGPPTILKHRILTFSFCQLRPQSTVARHSHRRIVTSRATCWRPEQLSSVFRTIDDWKTHGSVHIRSNSAVSYRGRRAGRASLASYLDRRSPGELRNVQQLELGSGGRPGTERRHFVFE